MRLIIDVIALRVTLEVSRLTDHQKWSSQVDSNKVNAQVHGEPESTCCGHASA